MFKTTNYKGLLLSLVVLGTYPISSAFSFPSENVLDFTVTTEDVIGLSVTAKDVLNFAITVEDPDNFLVITEDVLECHVLTRVLVWNWESTSCCLKFLFLTRCCGSLNTTQVKTM